MRMFYLQLNGAERLLWFNKKKKWFIKKIYERSIVKRNKKNKKRNWKGKMKIRIFDSFPFVSG